MQRNLSHIISQATSAPLLLEPAYARVFFCALGRESGINSLHIPGNNESLDQSDMALVTGDFMATGKPQARFYQVVNGIAVLPVTGTLVHKLGGMRPFSGMTGYDGVTARLQQAVSDPEVKGILLDIDSPGGHVAGGSLFAPPCDPDVQNGINWCGDGAYQLRRKTETGRDRYHPYLFWRTQG